MTQFLSLFQHLPQYWLGCTMAGSRQKTGNNISMAERVAQLELKIKIQEKMLALEARLNNSEKEIKELKKFKTEWSDKILNIIFVILASAIIYVILQNFPGISKILSKIPLEP